VIVMSFSWEETAAWVLPLEGYKGAPIWTPQQMKILLRGIVKAFNENVAITWVLQHAPFDLRFMHRLGVDIRRIRYVDLLCMQVLKDENVPKDLESMALMYTDLGNMKAKWYKRAMMLRKDPRKALYLTTDFRSGHHFEGMWV